MSNLPNAALVEEVFSLVDARCILKTGKEPLPELVVEPSLVRAKELAWNETYPSYTWTDIRELAVAAVHSDAHQTPGRDQIRRSISNRGSELLPRLRRYLSGAHADLLDDILADLTNCAFKRAVQGPRPGLLEDIYQVYASGGWPCGWAGNYPDGRLVAYYPPAEARR
jgi:hypothetical protein